MLRIAIATLRFFSRSHALTPTTNTPASVQPLSTVWINLFTATGDSTSAQKSVITLRICSGSNSIPTGYCIQAFATRIHSAEIDAPSAVSHVEARWNLGDTFFQPKNITAMNVDSMKNAKIPSIASGAPKISPTNQL